MKLLRMAFFIVAISFSMSVIPCFAQEISQAKQNATERAITELLKKIEKYPDDYFLNAQLGWNYYLVGKHANAIFHYEKALKKNRWSFEPRMGLYHICMAKMDFQQAETHCREILAIDPINYYGALYLSKALTAQSKYAEAKTALIYILNFFPSDALLNAQYSYILATEKK